MGNIGLDACTCRREDGRELCDVTSRLFGEDAFYRDAAFVDCEEGKGSVEADRLFANAREQAWLKMRKGSVLARYASFELQQGTITASRELRQCIATPKGLTNEANARRGLSRPTGLPDSEDNAWLGRTLPEWRGAEPPPCGEGPYWGRGSGEGLKVRAGPDYARLGKKAMSSSSMYEVISCDAIKADTKIENVVGRLVKNLPPPPEIYGECDRSGGTTLQWKTGCPLPRVICINMMLPYTTGVVPFKKDGGCSFVALFQIKPETLQALDRDDPPAAVRLFRAFCEGPAGEPGGPADDPNRCLLQRVNKAVKKDKQAGLFKAIAHCLNPEDLKVPDMMHQYNGKPCVIAKCGYIIKDPAGEWMEIGVDVRGFNVMCRRMLCSFRHVLPSTKIHYGFLIQGVEDEELPEGLLCDMYLHGIDMLENPVSIDNAAE